MFLFHPIHLLTPFSRIAAEKEPSSIPTQKFKIQIARVAVDANCAVFIIIDLLRSHPMSCWSRWGVWRICVGLPSRWRA